jgi:hypothetical protein
LKKKIIHSKILGYVYTIHILGSDIIKIGYTRKLEKRLIELQSQSKYELKLIDLIVTDDPELLEEQKHKEYSDFKIPQSEWFAIKNVLSYEKYFANTITRTHLYNVKENKNNDLIDESDIINGMILYGNKIIEKYSYINRNWFVDENGIIPPPNEEGIILIKDGYGILERKSMIPTFIEGK